MIQFFRVWAFACAMACAPGVALAARADPPTIADFVAGPALTGASLSPSGRYLSWIVRSGSRSDIHIRNIETDEISIIGGGSSRANFGGIFLTSLVWKTDDRLLVGMTRLEINRAGGREGGAIRSFNYGQSVVSVKRDGSGQIALRPPQAGDGEPGEVLDVLADDPDHILMTYRDSGGALDVARVNVADGTAEKVLTGNRRVAGYLTDRTGAVMGRIALRGLTGRVMVMEARNADDGWTEVYRLKQDEVRKLPDYQFLGATAEPGKIYVSVQPEAEDGEDTAGIHIFDFATRTMGPTIWSNPDYDVSGIVLNEDTNELVAGCYWADIYRCDFKDPHDNAVMNGIRRFFGDGWSVSVASKARDGSRWLVKASAPNNPGEYYLFNVAERHMDFLGSIYPNLPEDSLGQTRRVEYTALDGQALFGYLTRPLGAAADARLPLVVMPHGGPEMRDYLTYDRWAQFLATRGYQVLQPNFRGSAGFGRAFASAGYHQWGLGMQDDITAGVEALIAQGLADRSQVCIMGASYGGYAALEGGAAQPDLYRCVISVSGPSDLGGMLRWERSEAGADSDRYEYWVKSIGDPRTDASRLESVSPFRHAADWRPPVLLIHGDADAIVPVAQSRDMERALRRAGKDVRLVILEGEGHNDWSTRTEAQVLTEMEAFLARNLPVARPEPAAAAAAPASEPVPTPDTPPAG